MYRKIAVFSVSVIFLFSFQVFAEIVIIGNKIWIAEPIEKQKFVMGWDCPLCNIAISLEELVKDTENAQYVLNIWESEIKEGYADELQIKRAEWLREALKKPEIKNLNKGEKQ